MFTSIECVPCLIRQAIEASRLISSDEIFQEKVMREILKIISLSDFSGSPPLIARDMHRKIREISGIDDPYADIKKVFNNFILTMKGRFAEMVNDDDNPLLAVLKLAIAGNVIDSGAKSGLTEEEISESINSSLTEKLEGDIDFFLKRIAESKRILYIADNAGEIIFDRLFIEKIGADRVTLSVRGFPVINDATKEDAIAAGLDQIVNVIDNGSDAPGTILKECSEEFCRYFKEADLIIAKGQGNYETLSGADKEIFFLLKVKCPLISDHTGLKVGTHAVIKSSPSEKEKTVPEKSFINHISPLICSPIGVIHSEHKSQEKTPIQPIYASGCMGHADIYPEYAGGLKDLEGFSHIYIIFHLHKSGLPRLHVNPYLDDSERGVFSTRAPSRPNPIGMSIVKLISVDGNRNYLDGLDMLDGTPVLDIKPYTARFDRIDNTKNGWMDSIKEKEAEKRGRRSYEKRSVHE